MIREKKPAKKDVPDEKINYRLIQDWEVPTWITESVKEEVEVDPLLQNLGKRKRAEVNYKEHISDTAWLKLIEDGKDPAKELALRQKRKALEIE